MSTHLTPCSEEDFLEQDKEIRGQNYVCLSFLSPEEVIQKKELYYFQKFQNAFSEDLGNLFKDLKAKFPTEEDAINSVQDMHSYLFSKEMLQERWLQFLTNPALEKEYNEANNFQTSLRGIKVRGVYETLREAQVRSEVLKRTDKRHNIYIAQVGCWCPWSPNPDDIQDQEFAETTLNTMMSEYRKNQDQKDAFYQARTDELKEVASRKTKLLKEKVAEEERVAASTSSVEVVSEETVVSETAEALTDEDPWMKAKKRA